MNIGRQNQPVGRESEAHPAFSIIPSLDCERYHLPPMQGYKCRVLRVGESLNTQAQPRSFYADMVNIAVLSYLPD